MILSFKKEINGNPTHFETKILMHLGEDARAYGFYPKKLTIRDDPHHRWIPGRKIHFATGARTKQYECFAMGECTKVSTVVFAYNKDENRKFVFIEGRDLTYSEVQQLAQDDGFDDVYAFTDFHLDKNVIVTKKIIYF